MSADLLRRIADLERQVEALRRSVELTTRAELPPVIPLAHSPSRAGQRLGVSQRQVYLMIASGELRSYKIGKRRLIADTECQRLQKLRMAEAA